jgi:hypothetical protein
MVTSVEQTGNEVSITAEVGGKGFTGPSRFVIIVDGQQERLVRTTAHKRVSPSTCQGMCMHTIKVIADGLLLVAIFLVVGGVLGDFSPRPLAHAAKWFISVWLIGAALNMSVGVS